MNRTVFPNPIRTISTSLCLVCLACFTPSALAHQPPKPDPATLPAAASPEFTIMLGSFRGPGAPDDAARALAVIQTRGQLPDAFIEPRGEAFVLAVGRFPAIDHPDALQRLKDLQETQIDASLPYAFAFLAPLGNDAASAEGMNPQINLVRAKELYRARALYTLQVGVYGRDDIPNPTDADLTEARRKAEQGAAQLRREGELAFYYHGPRLSMVTVGVFNDKDFDPQKPTHESAELAAARKRFPYNLYNGAGVEEKTPGAKKGRLQRSALVLIPDA